MKDIYNPDYPAHEPEEKTSALNEGPSNKPFPSGSKSVCDGCKFHSHENGGISFDFKDRHYCKHADSGHAPFRFMGEDSVSPEWCPFTVKANLSWQGELEKVKYCPAREDGLQNQLIDLSLIANRFGFRDAADFLNKLNKP